ncbi:MAG: competence protein ComFB [Methylococcaceae bacterium]|nr:MAG: competence protein ComFB [Methylococcaceae bacterium]
MLNISNYYERLVIDRLWQICSDATAPFTQTFLEDVACLALNRLPPSYMRSTFDKSSHLSEQEYQEMTAAVEAAVAHALIQVSNHPHLEAR